MDFKDYKVGELIEYNYLYASVFHFFGIDFEHYFDSSLERLAKERHLNLSALLEQFDRLEHPVDYYDMLSNEKLEVMLACLRKMHKEFIQMKLPYIVHLVDHTPLDSFTNAQFGRDLKVIFPVFVEDFIKHIFEEENTLFHYVESLLRCQKNTSLYGETFLIMCEQNMKSFVDQHVHQDEMEGVRELMNQVDSKKGSSLEEKIILTELASFDKTLEMHARIEDELFMPKAHDLEEEVSVIIESQSHLN